MVGYKVCQVPHGYVAAGMGTIEPIRDIIEALKVRQSLKLLMSLALT